ncbi:MAG: DMT family transporter [Oscillospiraceae bacterium]|nr:DMT family transporter [Oscillospiraceae bacterium]
MITVLLWGSAFPAIRYTLRVYSPEALMLFRFLLASITLIAIGAAKKIRLPKPKDLPMFALGGFVGVFLYMLFSKNGAVYTEAGIGSFIVSSSPVFVLVLATLLLREKVRRACWVGVIVSFVGLVVIMLSQATGLVPDIGVLFFLLATIATSLHSIIQRKLTRSYTAIEATTYSIIFATLFMLIYSPALIREIPGTSLSTNLLAAYLGIFPAAIAYLSWGWAIAKAEKTAYVTVFIYLIPLIASALAYFWLGETLSLLALLGGAVVIAGMVITNVTNKK